MQHTISVLVENEFGVLSRVASLFSGRGFNIESLTVAPTNDEGLSRMTIVTRCIVFRFPAHGFLPRIAVMLHPEGGGVKNICHAVLSFLPELLGQCCHGVDRVSGAQPRWSLR